MVRNRSIGIDSIGIVGICYYLGGGADVVAKRFKRPPRHKKHCLFGELLLGKVTCCERLGANFWFGKVGGGQVFIANAVRESVT